MTDVKYNTTHITNIKKIESASLNRATGCSAPRFQEIEDLRHASDGLCD